MTEDRRNHPDERCTVHSCPFGQVIMSQQEQIGQHAAQIAAHDKVLEGIGQVLKELSDTLRALSDSVHEHHTRDDDAAKLRLQVAEELEKRNARRQWVLGISLTIFIALHDHLGAIVRYLMGLT